MTHPTPSFDDWRARVEAELGGRAFDDALVTRTPEGLAIRPLYTEAARVPRVVSRAAPFRICVRHTTAKALADDLDGGADAVWSTTPVEVPPGVALLVDDGARCTLDGSPAALVSTLADHDAGADAADDVALACSGVADALGAGASAVVVRFAVGRDTFVELCKVRALRLAVRKVFAAVGVDPAITLHAVGSERTLTTRDPWVNLLRGTTQAFAAILGGADLVTVLPFDAGLAATSDLGRRVARNTGHVLREESGLGRVVDPAAGSYALDTLTDELAREAWSRFRELRRDGRGPLDLRVARAREAWRAKLARRKAAVLGVSEFADLGEPAPGPLREDLSPWRDGADFEALRTRADALPAGVGVVHLATLGTFAESRGRVGYATNLFAAGGLSAPELTAGDDPPPGSLACLCGSDERYAEGAAARTRALKAAGVRQVWLAGRPGALEGDLRAAGVDGFLFLGGDAVATLSTLLGALEAR